jgi:hypothetical protein
VVEVSCHNDVLLVERVWSICIHKERKRKSGAVVILSREARGRLENNR